MNAIKAVQAVKNEMVEIFGHDVKKHNYAWEVRSRLQEMAEAGEISPAVYYKSLKLTWVDLNKLSGKSIELKDLMA